MSYNNSQYSGSQYSGSQYSGSQYSYSNSPYPSNNTPVYRKPPKKKKGFLVGLIIFFVAAAASGAISSLSDSATTISSEDMITVIENHTVPIENCYHYSQLDEYGQHIYREILANASSGTADFTIENVTDDDYENHYINIIHDAVTAIDNDHPEFFWLGNGYSSTYLSASNSIALTVYQYDFWKNSTQKEEMVNELFTVVDEIVANANQLNTDYEKIKYIHDYIIDVTVYDHEALEDLSSPNKNRWYSSNPYHQTSYGALVKGLCVCAGYADAFQLLTQQLGYNCMNISGDTPYGSHAWNMIELDGDFYYFDTTWDDTDAEADDYGNRSYPDSIQYEYFGITTKEFVKDHTDRYFTYPLCTATDYNYHYVEGYVLNWYSESKMIEIIEDQLYNDVDEISLKFSDSSTHSKAYNYLYNNFYNITSDYGDSREYLFYYDEDRLLVYFRPKQ